MKKLLFIFAILFASCEKDYSLEYFKTYNAAAPCIVLKQSEGFKNLKCILWDKTGRDLFKVTVLYIEGNMTDHESFALFNHNGKQIAFKQVK
jgi:hypothetical protein